MSILPSQACSDVYVRSSMHIPASIVPKTMFLGLLLFTGTSIHRTHGSITLLTAPSWRRKCSHRDCYSTPKSMISKHELKHVIIVPLNQRINIDAAA